MKGPEDETLNLDGSLQSLRSGFLPEEEPIEQRSIIPSLSSHKLLFRLSTSSLRSKWSKSRKNSDLENDDDNDDDEEEEEDGEDESTLGKDETNSSRRRLEIKKAKEEQQRQDSKREKSKNRQSQQVAFDASEVSQSELRVSVSEPFSIAPLSTSSSRTSQLQSGSSRGVSTRNLFQRRQHAKMRSPNTQQAEVPGAVHVDNSIDVPPERLNNNNSTFNSDRASTIFQEDEPLDPLMDDQVFSHGSSELFASSFASSQSSHNDEEAFDLTLVDEESSPFSIDGVTEIEEEINKKKRKKVQTIIAVVVVVLGLCVGITLGLLAIPDPSIQTPILNDICEIDYSIICHQQDQEGMEMGTFVVPECARTTYQRLINEFFFNSSSSSSSLSAAITNATNNTDIDTRIFQPCEPSFLALLSLAVTTTSSTTSMNYQVEKYRQDYFALATLYFSTGGPNWNIKDNWLMDPDICVWFGVSCLLDDPKKSLTEIKLNGNNLVGSLPSEIALMMNLRSLIIENNRFLGGTIPTEIGTMQQLGHLSLFTTSVEGTIPTEIGNCQSLRFLIIQSDMLSGSIPSELGQLRDSLDTLELESLSLTGTIPTELGMLNKMIYLALAVNGVSGTFPSEMAKLTSLETLVVNGAQLQVTELSSHLLGLTKLRTLILFDSIFATTFPSTISQLSSLENLGLIKNSFHGTLPTELGLLTNLTELRLNEQDFIGQLPTQLGKLTKLTNLDLSNIGITGSLPSELGLLSNLSEFILAGNFFSGTLPSELCSLKENIVFDNDDFLLGEQPFIKDNCESSQRI